jgi:hypothetical protein
MSLELTNQDYKDILNYYKLSIPKSKKMLKVQAEKIMSEKLCKCIKRLDPENEARSIGICTRTIFNNRGYTRGKFTCTKKRSVQIKKRSRSVKNRTK